jgi:hypothetical protein
MPPEILEKIFDYLPQHMLEDISLVCTVKAGNFVIGV